MPVRGRFTLLCLTVALVLLLAAPPALGQAPVRIGVVLPGEESAPGSNWNELLAARAWAQVVARAGASVPVEVHFRDGGTTFADTAPLMEELIEEVEVHAVVCCVNAAAAASVAPYVARLPVISLARPAPVSDRSTWPLVLPAGPLAQARAMTLDARRFAGPVALMTLDNQFGEEMVQGVAAGLLEAGLPLARVVRYAPGAQVLTPEGLLVAASEPSAVIVWGLAGDTITAVRGLRQRGYEGPVYLPWTILDQLPGGVRYEVLDGARIPLPPALLEDSLPTEHPNAGAVGDYRGTLARAYGAFAATAPGALAYDALELLHSAAELAVVYGVGPATVERFRQALYDGLIAAGPVDGAAGSYDYDGRNPELALASGLVTAVVTDRVLLPAGSD